MSKLNIFDLESKDNFIPFDEWPKHKDKLPIGVWNLLENEINYPSGPTGLCYSESLGYYIIGSGQGPFVIWMEKPQTVDGPYPYDGKPHDYSNVKLQPPYLTRQESDRIDNDIIT